MLQVSFVGLLFKPFGVIDVLDDAIKNLDDSSSVGLELIAGGQLIDFNVIELGNTFSDQRMRTQEPVLYIKTIDRSIEFKFTTYILQYNVIAEIFIAFNDAPSVLDEEHVLGSQRSDGTLDLDFSFS